MHCISHPSPCSLSSCDLPVPCSSTSGLPCLWGPGDSGWSSDTVLFHSYVGTLPDGNSGLVLARWPTGTGAVFGSYSNDELILTANGIQALDDSIFEGMTALKKVDISGNNIMELPSNICDGLVSVKSFNASNNALTALPSGIFTLCTSMTQLDVHGNAVTNIAVDAFQGLGALEELWVHEQTAKGAGLTTLPSGLLGALGRLKQIGLNSVGLETLPLGFFGNQSALLRLYLHTNSISCLPSDSFRALTNLTRLEIHGNPDLECGGYAATSLPDVVNVHP